MKKNLFAICTALAIAALASSCNKENSPASQDNTTNPQRETPADWITLTFKAQTAKTTLDPDGTISWADGDEIKFIWSNEDDGWSVGTVDENGNVTVQVAPAGLYYAVYPADATASIDTDGNLDVTLTQKPDGSWAKANIMAATATMDSDQIFFNSVCNYLKFEVEDTDVTGIAFCANDNTSYNSNVKMTPDGTISEGTSTRTEVQANLQGAGTYYVPVPASLDWEKGFGVLYKYASSNRGTLTTKALKFSEGKNCINFGILGNQFHEGDWFIKEGGAGTKDGSSWENAGDERLLKDLLGNSQASANKTNGWRLNGKTIRVAAGTYDMKDNVNDGLLTLKYESMTTFSVVGGYAGNETDLSQNDPVNNVTVFTSSNSSVQNNRMFTVNNSKMSCTFDGIKFTGTQYSGRGGIIYFNDGNGYGKCEFTDCTFDGIKNTSYGGAIDLNNPNVADFLSFTNCTFSNNSATYGGAVIIEASKGETGPVFNNCTFTGNQSTASSGTAGGGAIYVKGDNTTVTINGGAFNGNTTKTVGGGAIIAVGKASELRIINTHFENNVSNATGGGAIALSGGGTSNLGAIGYINGCTFKKNECKNASALDGNGGAILQVGSNSSLLFMNACSFDDNAAKTNGSDLFASAGSATCVYNCTSATPRNGSVAANLGTINCNCPLFIANSTMIVYGKGGTTTGVVRFGVNDSNKNFLINNLLLCNDGCSMGTGSTSTSVNVKSKGHNVYYAVMSKIGFIGGGESTDKTEVKASDIWSSAPAYNTDGLIEWNGPTILENFTPATKQNVIDAMTSYAPATKTGYSDKFGSVGVGTVFYNWLVSIDAFDKDGAGNSRGEGNWWPGSYQK